MDEGILLATYIGGEEAAKRINNGPVKNVVKATSSAALGLLAWNIAEGIALSS
ncbi:MAG: hypothetical protein QXV17_04555 [Candidatus Micrarchaeaceae archaeon]